MKVVIMNTRKSDRTIITHISCLTLCMLLFAKGYIFYSGLSLGGFGAVFASATCAIFLLIYFILQFFSPKAAKITLIVIYCIRSVVMTVDSVFFSYVAHLPSVRQLAFAAQLTDVSDTVMGLVTFKHILMLIDLPVLILYSAHRDLILSALQKNKLTNKLLAFFSLKISKKIIVCSTSVLVAFFAIFVSVYPNFQTKYLSNEIFCYHIYDVVDSLFISSRPREVDKSLYTSPDYSDGEYFGVAEGRNVIVIQVEALQNFVIGTSYNGQEITPNLNKLIEKDSFYFDNYYYQIGGGNTADAEFSVNNSLFAPDAEAAYIKYTDNTYYGLPHILKDNGYSGAHAYHNYKGAFWNREYAYPALGFDSFTSLEDMQETDMFPLGLSDREMFRQTFPSLLEYKEPFYAFYITVSSHHPYSIPEKDITISLLPDDENTLFGQYIQAINYADRAIGEFIDTLKDSGLYENSVIVIYGDHYALTNTNEEIYRQVSELTDGDYTLFDVFNVPLIMSIPGCDISETVHTAGGHIDVMPTLLYLLGITNDRSVMFGQNLIEEKVGLVPEQAHVAIGSFISDDVFFRKPYNNIKSNYDAYDKTTLENLDPDQFSELSKLAEKRIRDCIALLDKNDLLLN